MQMEKVLHLTMISLLSGNEENLLCAVKQNKLNERSFWQYEKWRKFKFLYYSV